jgi:hypothetical protein
LEGVHGNDKSGLEFSQNHAKSGHGKRKRDANARHCLHDLCLRDHVSLSNLSFHVLLPPGNRPNALFASSTVLEIMFTFLA